MSNTFRGRGRGRGNRRDFGSEEVEKAEAAKLADKQDQIKSKQNQPPRVVDQDKKQSLISKGQAWINKHFQNIEKEDRGNIKVTFNENIDYELYDVYEPKLHSIVSNQMSFDDERVREAQMNLKPLINVMIGIKLIKANTNTGSQEMFKYKPLGDMELMAPKRLGAFIDNIGKSDAMYDNVIRIKGHNSVIKRLFFKSIMDVQGMDEDKWDDNFVGTNFFTFQNVKNFRDNHILKDQGFKLYDLSLDGVKYVNAYGTQALEKLNNTDINVGTDDEPVFCRIPFLDPKDLKNIEKIMSWEAKIRRFFTRIEYDYQGYVKTIGSAIIGYMPLKWLRRRSEKIDKIDTRFENTVFSKLTPDGILKEVGFYPLEEFMSEDDLINNIIYFLDRYDKRYRSVYSLAYELTDFKPTAYGSSAQVVTGHVMTNQRGFIDDNYEDADVETVGSTPAGSAPIRMKEDEAVLGSIFRFNTRIDFRQNYKLFISGKTRQIKMEYFAKDFR